MDINKIKQVIELQKEIRKEDKNVIEISLSNDRVLVCDKLFKEIFENEEYSTRFLNGTYFYEGEFEGVMFRANNDSPIFKLTSEVLESI